MMDLSSLLGNPAVVTGLGLLSAGRDRRVDPSQAIMQGLLSSAQYQQQQQQGDIQKSLLGIKQQDEQTKAAALLNRQAAITKVQGLLAQGDTQGAAREAIGSGDEHLIQLAKGLLENPKGKMADFEAYLKMDPATRDQFKEYSQVNRADVTPYGQFLPTPEGYMFGNQRTGQISQPLYGGNKVLAAQYDPNLKGQISQAEGKGRTVGEATGTAEVGLPQYLANAQQSVELIDKALTHPGKETATGLSGTIDPRNYLAGTDAANFNVLLDQIKGKTFLEAYQGLKGAGAITEVEGNKAENAIARLSTKQSTAEFDQSLRDLKDVIGSGIGRMKNKAQGNYGQSPTTTAPTQAPKRLRFNPATGNLE